MVVGVVPYGLGLVEQLDATLHQGFFELFEEIEELVGHRLVDQGPQPLLRQL